MNFLKKHFLDLVLVISMALLIWSAVQVYQINKLSREAAVLSENLSVLSDQTANLKNRVESLDFSIEEPPAVSLGEYTVTAYCSCEKCCGKWAKNRKNNIICGASGAELKSGYSVASNSFKFGTVLKIEGFGNVEVQDRTSEHINDRYGGKIIDIYFDTHEEALEFGKQTKSVYIFN